MQAIENHLSTKHIPYLKGLHQTEGDDGKVSSKVEMKCSTVLNQKMIKTSPIAQLCLQKCMPVGDRADEQLCSPLHPWATFTQLLESISTYRIHYDLHHPFILTYLLFGPHHRVGTYLTLKPKLVLFLDLFFHFSWNFQPHLLPLTHFSQTYSPSSMFTNHPSSVSSCLYGCWQ